MKFGFSTYFFTGKRLFSAIEKAMSHGIRVFELSMEIPHVLTMDTGFFREIERLGAQGVEFSMHAPFFEINLGSFFEDIRAISKERIKDALRVAGTVGASPVVVHPGYTFLSGKARDVEEKARANFIEDLSDLSLYAKELGVTIALENVHMPYFFLHELGDFARFCERVPHVGLALDVGHAYIVQHGKGAVDPEGAILSDLARLGPHHLIHVHLHGNSGIKDDHAFLKNGVDLKRIVHGLAELGYKGKVIVESYDMEQHGIAPVVEKLERLKP